MSDFLTVFFGTIVLSSMVIIVHLKAAYHPYHNPIPLIISSLAVMSVSYTHLTLPTNREV